MLLAHRQTALRDNNDAIADATILHPFADHGLGFASFEARGIAVIDICGIDRVEPGIDERIEKCKARVSVSRPAEHVATQHQRCNSQSG